MPNFIPEIITAFALSLPCDGRAEHCWFGVTNYYAWNTHGYGVKVSWWINNEVHIAIGKNGFLFGQCKILPAIW